MKQHLVTILILMTASVWCANSTQAEDPLQGKRADWLRGSWGLNWKPVNLYNGRSESLAIDDFLKQISGLKTLDYLQLHLGDSHKNSCVHLGTHDLLESLWQGDTDARGNPINLVVPRKSAGVDPFLKMLKATKAVGLKTQLYVNSANMLAFTGQNPSAFPNITERWKAWCDTDPKAQAFIASQSYHTHARHPNRKYMFCYAEFVLKDYSIRYGDLVDGWLFDAGHQFIGRNGDNPTSGVLEEQRIYTAFADACRVGNPNAAVCFNNGPERDTEELNPFSEAVRAEDYMFGHPYAPRVSLGDHATRTYERNYAHIQKITETGGNVHAGGAWKWDDRIVGHFDPPMSSTRWNTGTTPGLTDEEFLLWNLESARGGGAISWGAPLVRPEGAGDELLIRDWGMAQLVLMDEHLSVHQAPGSPNWSRAETPLPDASFGQGFSRTLVEGVDFWDPEGDAVTLSLIDAPAWLSLKQDSAQPGRWLLQGSPTDTSVKEYKFRLRAQDASGATERWVELKVELKVDKPARPSSLEGSTRAQATFYVSPKGSDDWSGTLAEPDVVGLANAQQKPNIIYLMADDQNLGSVGCYGNPEVETPNMDKLARDGVVFDRHYNTTAICMASRANVMTGMYEYKTGTNFEHGGMKSEIWANSYPMFLRESGYLTAFAGKFGFEVEGKGFECGEYFDWWGGGPVQTEYETAKNPSMVKYAKKYPHSTLSYGAFGKDVIREAANQNKPFCLSISFKAPHRPVTPDPKFNDVYAGKKFTKPSNYGRENGEHFSAQSKQGRQYPRFSEWKYDTDYDGVMAKYYQQIYAIDVALGMIRDELETQGVADNTVIIYTSDNGFLCGAHGYGSKVLPIEESARAPLMIYDPRSPSAGKQLRSPALTGNIDFAPTILELAGLPIPGNMDGVSLLPLLSDPASDVRKQLAFINVFGPPATHSLTAITKEWKYTYWWYGDANMEPTEDLFHLSKDPLEMKNLAGNQEAAFMLYTMRRKYDEELLRWKAEAVPFNRYPQYGEIFDRSIPWDQKTVDSLVHGAAQPNKQKEKTK